MDGEPEELLSLIGKIADTTKEVIHLAEIESKAIRQIILEV